MARRLAKIRDHLQMSQQELANEFNTTQNLIYRLENGLKVSREMFTLISLYFIRRHKVNHEWLYNPDPEDDANVPMFASEQAKRQKIQDQREGERLALIRQLYTDLQRIEQQ